MKEYKCLENFTSQYTGEWNPSCGHWIGLDFMFNNRIYRFSSVCMQDEVILPSGCEALYYVYRSSKNGINDYPLIGDDYILVGAYSSMRDVLDNCYIDGIKFKEVILADDSELLGQD